MQTAVTDGKLTCFARLTIHPNHLLNSCHYHLCYLERGLIIHRTVTCHSSGKDKVVFLEESSPVSVADPVSAHLPSCGPRRVSLLRKSPDLIACLLSRLSFQLPAFSFHQ